MSSFFLIVLMSLQYLLQTIIMKHKDIEQSITERIVEIDRQFKKLDDERRQLKQLLEYKNFDKIEDAASLEHKNSLTRVLVELRIIEMLTYYKRPLTTKELFDNINNHVVNGLKPATFRVYLHRMKIKNIIKLEGKVGVWALKD